MNYYSQQLGSGVFSQSTPKSVDSPSNIHSASFAVLNPSSSYKANFSNVNNPSNAHVSSYHMMPQVMYTGVFDNSTLLNQIGVNHEAVSNPLPTQYGNVQFASLVHQNSNKSTLQGDLPMQASSRSSTPPYINVANITPMQQNVSTTPTFFVPQQLQYSPPVQYIYPPQVPYSQSVGSYSQSVSPITTPMSTPSPPIVSTNCFQMQMTPTQTQQTNTPQYFNFLPPLVQLKSSQMFSQAPPSTNCVNKQVASTQETKPKEEIKTPEKKVPEPTPEDQVHQRGSKQDLIKQVKEDLSVKYSNLIVGSDHILRGERVCRCHVKTKTALLKLPEALETILGNHEIEVEHMALPFCRKNESQLKGLILYLKVKEPEQITIIQNIFKNQYPDVTKKCDLAMPKKARIALQQRRESMKKRAMASSYLNRMPTRVTASVSENTGYKTVYSEKENTIPPIPEPCKQLSAAWSG